MVKFYNFLSVHNPYKISDKNTLVNIATGLVASDDVDMDNAIEIGERIHQKIDGTNFGDIKLRKADQAKTFIAMRKCVKVQNEKIHMSTSELFQGLIATVCVNGPPEISLFAYELPLFPQLYSTMTVQ